MSKLSSNKYKEPTVQSVLDLISIACSACTSPFAAAGISAGTAIREYVKSVSDIVLLQKIYQVVEKQDSDFEKWLKMSEKFEVDSANYERTVRQLVYTIESINENDTLNIYANLLRAYKATILCKEEFLRLGWIVSNTYSMDLMYLAKCYKQHEIEDTLETKRLEQVGLFKSESEVIYNSRSVQTTYSFTDLGMKMLSCGIDYENYDKYQKGGKK